MGTAILFDGVDDQMVYAGPPQLTGALTLLIVAKILNTADAAWLSFIENESSGGAIRPSLGRRSNGDIYYSQQTGLVSGTAVQDGDGWCIIACTKAAGTTTPKGHKIPIGGSRTTTAMDSSLANSTSYAGGNLRIGGNDDFANIEVACAAIFNKALTTTELGGINTAKTSQSILDLGPVWMVDASDGLVADQVGSVDRTSVVGTAAGSSDPTGWTYLGGGGTEYFGATSLTITQSVTTAGVRTRFGATSATETFSAATAGYALKAGASSMTETLTATTAGSKTTSGAVSVTETFTATTAGARTVYGATSLTVTDTITTAGSKTTFGVVSRSETLTATTAGYATKAGATSLPIVFSATTAGSLAGNASSSVYTFGATTAGYATKTGAASQTITLTVTSQGARLVAGASASTYTFTKQVAGSATKYGSITVSAAFTAATVGKLTAFSSATVPLVFAATTAGAITATSAGITERFDPGTPGGRIGPGTPSSGHFRSGRPRKVAV